MDTLIDALTLARIQFAANITFHILFPSISIALGWVLLFFKLRYRATNDDKWMRAYGFWVKIFALCFALGVVSGITMSFQFGTNWPGFMQAVGNVAGPLLAYEVLTAFFLEATFLGIMLFGVRRVSARVHTAATALVAFGTTLSAFWIIVLNSWMHTPSGFRMVNGKAHVTSWFEVVFNPSMPHRLTHVLLASFLTTAFLMAGISAYRWLRNDRDPAVKATLRAGVLIAAVLIPLQIAVGDLHGLNTLKHQPAKVAAMEGLWETTRNAEMLLFAWPDAVTKSNRYELGVPGLASLILTHERDGEIKGLNEFGDKQPPVLPVFFAFRVMVCVGLLMLLVSWVAAWQLRGRREPAPWLLRGLVGMSFAGWVATVAGWYTTEVGRQPYLVYEVLTTRAAAAANVGSGMLLTSLAMYLTLYVALIVAFITVVFYLARKAGAGNGMVDGLSAEGFSSAAVAGMVGEGRS
ncbi:MAG: cytochrome ubiquinol oxidase subunit I [Burkholderiaceae bacterium]|jgi:cytochrome d ubiquinol oxidase subunit I